MEKLTNSEELVMKAIWDLKKEPVLSEIYNYLVEQYNIDWKAQTVSTFLGKLVRKKYLKMKRNGKIYTYKPLIKEEAYKKHIFMCIINFWYSGNKKEFICDIKNL